MFKIPAAAVAVAVAVAATVGVDDVAATELDFFTSSSLLSLLS